MSTIHCYHVCKNGEAMNDHKVNTGFFCSKRLYNTFAQKLGLESQFEGSDEKSDTKYDRIKITTSKKAEMMVMGKWLILI